VAPPPEDPRLSIDETIDRAFRPIAELLSEVVFYSVWIGETEVPLIVVWLVAGAAFFTFATGFINVRGFGHALRIVTGKEDRDQRAPGEVSHFQALTTAVSGTVGVGNIAHVAVAVSVGGPGAAFWLVVAGFLGMASKFAECTLGVLYRVENEDGSTIGGPMYFLDRGLAEQGWPRLGRGLALYYAVCVAFGSVGVGMFQANQAYVQVLTATGGEASFAAGYGWVFGAILAVLVAVVIVGGIRSIARVTAGLVPLMALLYIGAGLFVIAANAERIPAGISAIVAGAFSPEGVAGGMLGVLVLGFRRAAFSNEAGIGSSSIAHAAVRTREPVTQGYVAMLEPFIDTVVVCSITALVIVTAFEPGSLGTGDVSGVELTSAAFEAVVPWFPSLLSVVVFLFAFSTLISWSYYGLAGCLYLFGARPSVRFGFNTFYCLCAVVGCTTTLKAILEFADAMIFAMAFANLIGLYWLTPVLRREIARYQESFVRRTEPASDA
jgi:AGCS family alanine or glycine:cation symporter